SVVFVVPLDTLPYRLSPGSPALLQLSGRAARNAHPDPSEALPASTRRADALPLAARLHARLEPMRPGPVHLRLRSVGGLALAGLLRALVRERRMADAGGKITSTNQWPTFFKSARAAAGWSFSISSPAIRLSRASH